MHNDNIQSNTIATFDCMHDQISNITDDSIARSQKSNRTSKGKKKKGIIIKHRNSELTEMRKGTLKGAKRGIKPAGKTEQRMT